jgi:hypothetical protein
VKLFRSGLYAGRIMTAVEMSGDQETRCRSRGPDEADDLLVAVERFAQFLEISEKRRCSMGFHLDAPVG